MPYQRSRTIAFLTSVTAAVGLTSALAYEGATEPVASIAMPAEAGPRANPLGLKALDPSALSGRRGGAKVLNANELNGVVSDTHATNVTTGSNFITEGSLAGSAGMPTVIQNSGNNVLIQNSTIVNLQMK